MTAEPSRPVRTRFAPSPTGRLHLGNVRIAVFNRLFTDRHGGQFVVRIEDTDTARNVEGAEAGILEDLAWLGIAGDEDPVQGGPYAPYRQSERGASYAEALDRLLASGAAYRCFAPEEEWEDRRYPGTYRDFDPELARARAEAGESHVVRLRTPDHDVEIHDEIRGAIVFPANDIDDFVIARADGRPTYNFAVVVDDIAMEITHVIRGAGHVSNTPKQQLVFEALGAQPPIFAHLPTVLSPEGGKLSKRSGAAAVADLRARGVPPAAIVNYLSLLGWSHPDEEEILTPDQITSALDLARVGASDTRYDDEKFAWVAGKHLQAMDEDAFVEAATAFVDRGRFPLDDESLRIGLLAVRSRVTELGDLNDLLRWIVPEEGTAWEEHRSEVRKDADSRRVIDAAARHLQEVDAWRAGEIKAALVAAGKEVGVRGAALFVPVRRVVTADEHGPEIGALLQAAGREAVLARLVTISTLGEV